ncbi:hypothetical protein [Vibrio sp. S234-5]|uniref:hypothetical protein n=1 Tax=Vibrio sp. S234-5 TaxID=1616781 RepID=UPI000AFAB427|nr:hypothetical protein [Vibrio sp. S234-5]
MKLTLTGYFWRYGIRKAIQVSIFRMNQKSHSGIDFPDEPVLYSVHVLRRMLAV